MGTKVGHSTIGEVLHMSYTENSSLEILTNVLLNIPRIFVAQAAAFSQCRENFKDDEVQTPRSFSKSTSVNL